MVKAEVKQIAEKIRTMEIRGAGLIARSGVKALKIAATNTQATTNQEFEKEIKTTAQLIISTRPSAVSLPNGIRFVLKRFHEAQKEGHPLKDLIHIVQETSDEFITRSLQAIKRIGEIGANRLRDGDKILTICNSSNVISVLKTAKEQGKTLSVIVAETRPRFQGRITAKALGALGIQTNLIVDGAIRSFVNDVDLCMVGADTITANGAIVNKVGTSMMALAAHEARTNLYVAAETYKFSSATMSGRLVKIEERSPGEIIDPKLLKNMSNVSVQNPAFDITPSEYVDLIITEKGIIPPQGALLILKEEYGWSTLDSEEFFPSQ
ncbi:MAG: ribose 1,5-bisphosphate isomerase [Candidatus Ranarchaeia archaeon]|jgi:ribose 1,5-bisphosphate isomerase